MTAFDLLTFGITGLLSLVVGLYSLRQAWLRRRLNTALAIPMAMIGAYFSWLAVVYGLVVVGILPPIDYPLYVRPLFNLLSIGVYLLIVGIIKLEHRV